MSIHRGSAAVNPGGGVSLHLTDDMARIRLQGQITTAAIFDLVDQIEVAIEYYRYPRVDIEIDSPGGELRALDYLLTKLTRWRENSRLVIGTLAMTEAASAAAVLLSMGTIGYRRAYPYARMLYHQPRLPTQDTVLTRDNTAVIGTMLAEAEAHIRDRLLDHLFRDRPKVSMPGISHVKRLTWEPKDVKPRSRSDAARILAALDAHDRQITALQAISLGLLDQVEGE